MMMSELKKRNERKMKKSSAAFSRGVVFTLLAVALTLVPMGFADEEKPVAPTVTSGKPIKISGYTQILGAAQDTAPDALSIRRSRFTLSVDLLKNFKAKFTIDAVRSPVLVDAMVDVIFSDAAILRVGQFLVPFGVESVTSTADLDMIDRSQAVDKLAPGRDIKTLGRDVGVMLTGKYSLFDYSIGMFNGSGANIADTNDKKDFAGRLGVKPLDFLTIGASFYKGQYNLTAGTPITRRDRTGLDAGLALGDVTVKGEYLWAVDDKTDKSGWFLQAAWFVIPKQFQVVAKIDGYDKNTATADDRTNMYSAGVNWFFSDRTKIQVNYEYVNNELAQKLNQALLVQFQVGF